MFDIDTINANDIDLDSADIEDIEDMLIDDDAAEAWAWATDDVADLRLG